MILRFTIVQNKFQQTNKTRINHINDYHIKFGFLYIFGRSGLLFGFAAVCWLVAADKANNYYSRSRKLPWSVAGLTTSRRFHSELSKANVYITQNETTTANEKKCQYLCLSWNTLKPQCLALWTIQFSPTTSFTGCSFSETLIFTSIKVQLFWEGHKNYCNLPNGFDVYY